MAKGRKKETRIELKYSLLNEAFASKIGKRLATRLKDSISNWTKDQSDKSADKLIQLYVGALSTYWKKTNVKDIGEHELTPDFYLIVDLVHKKGRKPNTVRLENNPLLKEELIRLLKSR